MPAWFLACLPACLPPMHQPPPISCLSSTTSLSVTAGPLTHPWEQSNATTPPCPAPSTHSRPIPTLLPFFAVLFLCFDWVVIILPSCICLHYHYVKACYIIWMMPEFIITHTQREREREGEGEGEGSEMRKIKVVRKLDFVR
ncbi:hypothetical protein E2C01_072037 [Portunus trituberculatus]|uniref:Uncharacterized protein n=1 Tax=Portunus trituberculatus TaxID=210409 RepID=A0A5B7HYN7_PORTR|nr:hypothetical protein [Portunus trituberculatus]